MKPKHKNAVQISPSLICLDLCRLEMEVQKLEKHGINQLHVDLLDGHFSPSMPIGLEVVRSLRARTRIPFDVHLMVQDNEFFIRETMAIGVQRICFHYESALHVDWLLALIQENGIEAGIALAPATPLDVLEYVVERLYFVLLMLINPGFAGNKGEQQVPYAVRKVAECRNFLDKGPRHIPIEIDGRVSFDTIPQLVAAGADSLVAGTACLFSKDGNLRENLLKTKRAINDGLRKRKEQCR